MAAGCPALHYGFVAVLELVASLSALKTEKKNVAHEYVIFASINKA
jgi:hypothetical protein